MIIKNGKVVTKEKILSGFDIKCENGKITEIAENLPPCDDTLFADGMFVLPGLVDIHTHGGFGADFMDATKEAFDTALSFHMQNGTTSVLASSVTAPVESIEKMLCATRGYMKKSGGVCRVLGAHIEGPFISYKNKGAQKAEYLKIPSKDGYSFITDNADIIKNVTIASELDGAAKMTKKLTSLGITVSCGHDDGNLLTLLPCIDAGMTNCTHWSCAMSSAAVRDGVRNVGLTELALIDERLTLELLADNHHLPPEMVKLAYKCRGADKLCIVSDCLRAGGMPRDGRVYSLGAGAEGETSRFIVSDGVARLTDGTRFAGSIQPLGQMIRNLVFDCNIPLVDAVKAASANPAKIIGEDGFVGSIEKGKAADFYICDAALNPKMTIVNQKIKNKLM